MAETSPTPGSGGESAQARTPAPKDKHCPYCDQLFTSSSLGRHLDLYIKEKNPKPPDGIHDIEEIRKLRGGITRRSARSSSVKRESLTPAHPKPPSVASSSQRSPSDTSTPQVHPVSQGKSQTRVVHEASWQHSGFMRDVPPASNESLPRLDTRRDSVRRYNVKSGVEHKEKLRDALDQGRAAELALREVLDSLKIASLRVRPAASPLPFDVFALTFPALVLQCLAAPPTLYSTSPFPTVNSWSLEPPGEMQLHALVDWLRGQYRQWKLEVTRTDARNERGGSGFAGHRTRDAGQVDGSRKAVITAEAAQEQEDSVIKHAMDAYSHWDLLPEKSKSDSWRLEILRAYSREKEKRQQVDVQLEEALQDVEHCKAQVDRLSRCQQPREFFIKPPTAMPVAKDTIREMNTLSNTPISDWDFDRLLNKWKMVVQENRRSATGMASQRPLSTLPPTKDNWGTLLPPPTQHVANGAYPTTSTLDGPSSTLPPPLHHPPTVRMRDGDSADENEDMEDVPMEDGAGSSSSVPTSSRVATATMMSARGSISVDTKNEFRNTSSTTPMSIDHPPSTTATAEQQQSSRPRGSISVNVNHPTFRGSIDGVVNPNPNKGFNVGVGSRMNDTRHTTTTPTTTAASAGGSGSGSGGGGGSGSGGMN